MLPELELSTISEIIEKSEDYKHRPASIIMLQPTNFIHIAEDFNIYYAYYHVLY
jgi:hypothetical protein